MIKVVEQACVFQPDMSKGTVVLESDVEGPNFSQAFDELNGMDARSIAQAFAASKGCAPAYLNGNVVGPYPINSQGFPLDMVRSENGQPLPQTHPLMQPARYRLEVPVSRPLR
jgi:hypothetical protein